MLVCPNIFDTDSMGTPLPRVMVVAKVWRAVWKVIGNARESGQVKMKRKTFEMSIVSVFCQMEKAQMTTEY